MVVLLKKLFYNVYSFRSDIYGGAFSTCWKYGNVISGGL